MNKHRPNTTDTYTHTEGFADELANKGAFCKAVCANKYQLRGQSIVQFWVIVTAVGLLVWQSFASFNKQATALIIVKDATTQNTKDISDMRTAVAQIPQLTALLQENIQRMKLFPRRDP